MLPSTGDSKSCLFACKTCTCTCTCMWGTMWLSALGNIESQFPCSPCSLKFHPLILPILSFERSPPMTSSAPSATMKGQVSLPGLHRGHHIQGLLVWNYFDRSSLYLTINAHTFLQPCFYHDCYMKYLVNLGLFLSPPSS